MMMLPASGSLPLFHEEEEEEEDLYHHWPWPWQQQQLSPIPSSSSSALFDDLLLLQQQQPHNSDSPFESLLDDLDSQLQQQQRMPLDPPPPPLTVDRHSRCFLGQSPADSIYVAPAAAETQLQQPQLWRQDSRCSSSSITAAADNDNPKPKAMIYNTTTSVYVDNKDKAETYDDDDDDDDGNTGFQRAAVNPVAARVHVQQRPRRRLLVEEEEEEELVKMIKNSKKNKKRRRLQRDTEADADAEEEVIHVRARRGEATDRHSLAERVRREKISQRMKLLQDLVPNCNKVLGKAAMLEEIINYVKSLQHQIEFLSIRLAESNLTTILGGQIISYKPQILQVII